MQESALQECSGVAKTVFVGVVTTLYSRLVEDRNDGTDGGPADRAAPTHLNAPPAT